jgi:Domain of unknown function (DUF1931)
VSHPMGIPLFQRFFHSGIEVEKNNLRRFRDCVDRQIVSIEIAGREAARWNGRDVIVPRGRPVTKGVQERMREFDNFDAAANVWSPSRLSELRFRCGRRLICCSIPTPRSWFAWWFAPLGPEQSTRHVQEKPRRHRS